MLATGPASKTISFISNSLSYCTLLVLFDIQYNRYLSSRTFLQRLKSSISKFHLMVDMWRSLVAGQLGLCGERPPYACLLLLLQSDAVPLPLLLVRNFTVCWIILLLVSDLNCQHKNWKAFAFFANSNSLFGQLPFQESKTTLCSS